MWVKHYLTGYAQQRAGGGYTVVHDSISAFHDALCVSMNYYGGNADGGGDYCRGEGAGAVGNGGGGDQGQQELAGAAAEDVLIDQGDLPAAAGWILCIYPLLHQLFFLLFTLIIRL